MVTAGPEVERLALLCDRVFRAPEDPREDHERLQVGVAEPNPELLQIEDHVLHADAVVLGIAHVLFTLELEVEESVPNVV